MNNVGDTESRLHEDIPSMLAGMLAGLESLWTVKQALHATMAYDFSLFNFISPHENMLSKILAFFLNPAEVHGQGDAFLKEFLRAFELTSALERVEAGSAVTVRTETRTTKNRRIDITVNIGENYWIGIENKVDAVDQPSQITDYVEDLGARSHQERFNMFYLSPNGHQPTEGSASKELMHKLGSASEKKLRCISYRDDINDLLIKFEGVCRADNVRAFIREFSRYVKREFRGDNVMGETEYLSSYIVQHPQLIQIEPQFKNAHIEVLRLYLSWLLEGLYKRYVSSTDAPPTVNRRSDFWDFAFSVPEPVIAWQGCPVEVRVQSEIKHSSPNILVFRVGVWSNDPKIAGLCEQYRKVYGAPDGGEYRQNGVWQGGFCEYRFKNAVIADLEERVLSNVNAKIRLDPYIDKVQTYLKQLEDLATTP